MFELDLSRTGGTYLFGLYKGVPPPPGGEAITLFARLDSLV